jgi:hypothetical protein
MSDESPESNEDDMAPGEVDWENRVLCIDESCIGVIGPDGRCKECGKSYEGSQTEESFQAEESLQAEEGSQTEERNATQANPEGADDFDAPEPTQTDTADDAWENRTLCIDESCIGVIGPDGRCTECGRRYKG